MYQVQAFTLLMGISAGVSHGGDPAGVVSAGGVGSEVGAAVGGFVVAGFVVEVFAAGFVAGRVALEITDGVEVPADGPGPVVAAGCGTADVGTVAGPPEVSAPAAATGAAAEPEDSSEA